MPDKFEIESSNASSELVFPPAPNRKRNNCFHLSWSVLGQLILSLRDSCTIFLPMTFVRYTQNYAITSMYKLSSQASMFLLGIVLLYKNTQMAHSKTKLLRILSKRKSYRSKRWRGYIKYRTGASMRSCCLVNWCCSSTIHKRA